MLEIRFSKLEEVWSDFAALQDDLYQFVESPDYVDPDPEFAEYEAKYFKTYSLLSNAIRDRKPKSVIADDLVEKATGQSATSMEQVELIAPSKFVHLPKISILHFSGDYKYWPAFRDLFTGTVDSNLSVTCAQKFYYFKSFLRGEAANLIKHMSISEANYIEAWDRLEKRYDQKHLIAQSFIQSFLSLPSSTTPNVQTLRMISDGADESIRGLNALGFSNRDIWLIYLLIQKEDHETRQAWAEEAGSRDNYTIIEFLEFLQTRCNCLESCHSLPRSLQTRSRTSPTVRAHFVESPQGCPKCKGDHTLSHCKDFIALNVDARRDFVKNNSLCFNCLRRGHASSKCRTNFHCRVCNSRHHSLVHSTTSHQTTDSNLRPSSSNRNAEAAVVTNHTLESKRRVSTVLPTALVRMQDKQGTQQAVRILLDSGSQVFFITERMAQRLGLPRKRSRIPIVGIGSAPAGVTNGLVTITLFSRYNSESIDIDCFVMLNLTSSLPPIPIKQIPESLLSLELADPTFYVPGSIDVLIGADKCFGIINGASSFVLKTDFAVIPTIFSWVVAGGNSQVSIDRTEVRAFCTRSDTSQEFDLERFWKLEEVSNESFLSLEEQLAEEIFVNNHTRRSDDRYEVHLPFKPSTKLEFGDSFSAATNQFYALERRFKFNNDLKLQYSAFINEYLSLGHMQEIPTKEIYEFKNVYYLPHHAVFKEDSSTTKIRVVFDASAKTYSSISLNEALLVGPTIQRDIFSICLRYRRHLYVISGGIEKMYRQIWITRNHTDFQRIVWRQNPEDPLKHYRLLTVTYGNAAAPFLAVRTSKQLALDSADTYPLASTTLRNDFYVDDVITGADTIEDLITLQSELVNLLKSAGFNLRKWTTNCWPVLLSLPEHERELSPVDFEEFNSVKILGLQWCPSKDCFSYNVNFTEASRILDPLGFLSPVIISIKILFQELCRKKLKWDTEIPEELAHQWETIRDELPVLESLCIPRMMFTNKLNWELHGFCDASLDAYAAVVYCRSVNPDGSIFVSLVAAKARVAPLKVLSLPGLELCGAVLLTRLINKIKLALQEPKARIFTWTDSLIVLHWFSASPKKWSVFIGNRTSEVLTSIPLKFWNHVRSASNPAAIVTRGISPSTLSATELWWKGPHWLSMDRNRWPVSNYNTQDIQFYQLEQKKVSATKVFASHVRSFNVLENILNNSSSWLKSVRVVAYVFRFLSNCRSSADNCNIEPLSSEEISMAKTELINCAQLSLFSDELRLLRKRKDLPQKNRLTSLSPYIDSYGVLRVGGRLEHSDLSFSEKHPILLCKSHLISKLIAEYLNKKHLHPGVSLLFALIRHTYYIFGSRNLSRKIMQDCVTCFRQRSVTTKQFMGNLPVGRIRYSRPFSRVGCDYADPITLRLSRGRNPKFVKAYIALFVCFVTKAINVELVADLSSAAFLLALDRFVARRGKPCEIWSDNGTNFHGARRLLNEMYKLIYSQYHNTVVSDHLSKDNIIWKFIPPSAPHFGGLWEAGVKSVKLHLKRVIGETKLTYEEMYTLLVKIESLLNSRPMWQTSDSEEMALSPAHFLIGEPYNHLIPI